MRRAALLLPLVLAACEDPAPVAVDPPDESVVEEVTIELDMPPGSPVAE